MTTTIHNPATIRTALLSSTLLLALAVVQPLQAMAFAPPQANDKTPYATGMRAMNEHRWPDAVKSFDKVIAAKESRADAALYWKAYSLQKMDRAPLAAATCARLRANYSTSSWNQDCAVLSIDTRAITNEAMKNMSANINSAMRNMNLDIHPNIQLSLDRLHPDNPNEDIKILALNSLLHQDPAKAIPMLRGILSSNQPMDVKKHAIFVLAQSKSPEAQSILHDAVTGKLDPALQQQAIQLTAIFQGNRDNAALENAYRSTSDPKIKQSIIQALFITHDAPRLVALARSEKDLNLKRSMVSELAVMHDKVATDYMMELLK